MLDEGIDSGRMREVVANVGRKKSNIGEEKGDRLPAHASAALAVFDAGSSSDEGAQAMTFERQQGRKDLPVMRPLARACKALALQASLSREGLEEALAALEDDMLANSSRNSVEHKISLYLETLRHTNGRLCLDLSDHSHGSRLNARMFS